MEGGGYRQRDGAAHPVRLAEFGHAVERHFVAGQHDLRRLVVVGDLADVALGSSFGHLAGGIDADAEQRRHGALADGNRRLHRLAAQLEKPGGVGERESAGRGKRRVFAERMAGDELHLIFQRKAVLRFEHPHHRHRHGHQSRLGVLGQREGLFRTLPHDLRQVLPERGIDLIEHLAGGGIVLRQLAAHADVLAALPGKYKCDSHACGALVWRIWLARTRRASRCQARGGHAAEYLTGAIG
jgi:hypothetical protein